MSSYISSINPINWFNYKGNKNNVEFSHGINVLVGTNNAGKTKLHNAFRFMISDTVILKVKEGSDKVFKEVSIGKPEYLIEVFNQSTLNNLSINETSHVGVELTFQKVRSTETKTFLLKKGFTIRKADDEKIQIENLIKEVRKIDPFTGGSRRVSDDFEDILNSLLPSRLRNFFLVEGEQMGMMTPLFGDGLKSTVKKLTNIHSIDSTVDIVDNLQKKVRAEKNKYEKSRSDLSEKEKNLINERIVKEEKITDLNKELEEISKIKENLEFEIKSLETSYNTSKSRHIKLNKLKSLRKAKEEIELLINDNDREYLDSFTNDKDFIISKFDDYSKIEDSFIKIDSNFNSYVLDRKTELNNKITKEEQELLGKLNLSQPHPAILDEMVENSQCFVCKSKLDEHNKNFIKEILIPHFKGETTQNDLELNNLETLKDSLKNIFNKSRRYSHADSSIIEVYKDKSFELHQKLKSADEEIKGFINNNGDEDELDQNSDMLLYDYGEKNNRLGKLKTEIFSKKEQIGSNKQDLKVIESKISNFQGKDDDKSNNFYDLEKFIDDLDLMFESLKEDIYLRFGEELQEKSTLRFANLMRNNQLVKGQSLVVDVDKIEIGFKTDYKFEVYLKDKKGNRLTQTGGASSTLEPLSVVFGLIDISNVRTGYPFIADAPVSRLTNDTKFSFFQTLIDDDIFDQSIIITMDLWDNKLEDINELGESVLALLKDSKKSSFITMNPFSNNEGVNFNYVLDGK